MPARGGPGVGTPDLRRARGAPVPPGVTHGATTGQAGADQPAALRKASSAQQPHRPRVTRACQSGPQVTPALARAFSMGGRALPPRRTRPGRVPWVAPRRRPARDTIAPTNLGSGPRTPQGIARGWRDWPPWRGPPRHHEHGIGPCRPRRQQTGAPLPACDRLLERWRRHRRSCSSIRPGSGVRHAHHAVRRRRTARAPPVGSRARTSDRPPSGERPEAPVPGSGGDRRPRARRAGRARGRPRVDDPVRERPVARYPSCGRPRTHVRGH